MPLKVSDGMGAWISDFKKSDAPQFKGKSDKDRREMAIAAYLDAKRGAQKEETKPPFDPDPPRPEAKNSDGTKTSPMSRARQLAKKARDRAKEKDEGYVSHAQRKAVWATRRDGGKGHPDNKKKNESVEENYNWKVSHGGKDVHVKAPHAGAAVKKAQKGFGNMDLTKAKVSNLGKVGAPTTEATVDTANIRSRQAMKKSDVDKLGKLADMLAKEKKPKKEAYRPPTQAEIDADKRKENRGKSRPSMTAKSATRNVYKNMMGGLKKESVELDEEKQGFFGTDNPKIGDAVKHRNGAVGKIKKIETQGDETYVHFKDKNGQMNYGQWKKHVHPMKESVELEEAKDIYKSAAGELKDYANKSGGIDKKDFHTAAKHIENIGRANLMNKGQHLAQLSKHLRNLDTSPREKVLSVLNKHGHNVGDFMPGAKMRRESVEENVSAPQTAAHRRAMMVGVNRSKRMRDNEKARQALKDPSHNPAWANSKSKTEETVSELKKSTLGSYVNKAAKDAASKAYGAASAAKDNNPEKGGKDFSKSMKRLRGIDTATKKLAKESVELDEAKYSWNDVNKALTKANYMRGNPAHINKVASKFDYKSGNDKKFSHSDVKRNLSAAGIDAARHHDVMKHLGEAVNNDLYNSDVARKAHVGKVRRKRQSDGSWKYYADVHNHVKAKAIGRKDTTVSSSGPTLGYKSKKHAKDIADKLAHMYNTGSAHKKAQTGNLTNDRAYKVHTDHHAKYKDVTEAKSFDQKFKDHLKFSISKSPAVQAYLKKRAADRDAMNKKNDPNAAKKGYALSAVPPERKNIKLRKHKQKQQ